MKRLALLPLLAVLLGGAGLIQTGPENARAQAGSITISVPATSVVNEHGTPPFDTGVILMPGVPVSITATGSVGLCGPDCYMTGPAGNAALLTSCGFLSLPAPDLPPFSLVAQVDGDTPVYVGPGPVTMLGNGPLRLSLNDCYAANNAGAFTVTITPLPAVPVLARPAAQACRGRAEPVTTTTRAPIEVTELDVVMNNATFVVYETVTVTMNYLGVEGLVQTTREIAYQYHTVASSSLAFPEWLLRTYQGNESAIRADLEAGILKDRGPCA